MKEESIDEKNESRQHDTIKTTRKMILDNRSVDFFSFGLI